MGGTKQVTDHAEPAAPRWRWEALVRAPCAAAYSPHWHSASGVIDYPHVCLCAETGAPASIIIAVLTLLILLSGWLAYRRRRSSAAA